MVAQKAVRKESFPNRGELWALDDGEVYVWCPEGREPGVQPNSFGSGQKLLDHADKHDEVIEWGRELTGDGHEAKAHIWAELHADRHSKMDFDTALREKRGIIKSEELKIPVHIAILGKARIAAYLYCHDVSANWIGSELQVSKRTAKQYISDVKRGVR
ncbi:hypothetical protein [Haladaptatus cibarius]|uniref:hypothetical protein n=1 Tax=Haladaptatus cibarius TaxID=453847 RepID=UPI00067975FD|nr:hypothetical protein [Haladaptatus cibarius]